MTMNATFLTLLRPTPLAGRKELVRTHQNPGHVPVGVGHNKGPLQILAETTFWTPKTAPGSPPALGLPLGAGLAHTKIAQVNAGAEPREEGLGPTVALAVET